MTSHLPAHYHRPAIVGFRWFSFGVPAFPRSQFAKTPRITGTSFTYVLRPLRAGITRIPAIVIQTFDPESGDYHTLRSETIPITVDVDQKDGSRTFTAPD